MFTQFLRRTLVSKIMATVMSVSFMLSSVPVSYANTSALKTPAAKGDLGNIAADLEKLNDEGLRGADTGFITATQHKAVRAAAERLEARNPKNTVEEIADDRKLTELAPDQIKGKTFFVRGSADIAFTEKLEGKKDFTIKDLYNPNLIADDIRIRAMIPTLKYLIESGAKIVLQPGWIGRPKGKEMAQFSLIPVYLRLKQLLQEEGLLKEEMIMAPNSLDGSDKVRSVYRNQDEVRKAVAALKNGQIVLLENPRFDPEEDANGEGYAKFLASLADYCVSECFAQLHRPTGSIDGITKYLTPLMGISQEKEFKYILGIREELLKTNRKPFTFILAGKKIETGVGIVSKMTVALSLLNNMQPQDKIKVGGAMAYTFIIAAQHLDKVKAGMDQIKKIAPQDIKRLIGDSYVEWDQIYDQILIAGQVLLKAKEKGVKISLPKDHTIRNKQTGQVLMDQTVIPEGWYGVDIGSQTIAEYVEDIENSGVGVIAGPVGICDDPKIPEATKGTDAIMRALEKIKGISAGGETTEYANRIGAKLAHKSIGGGSTLELLEKGTLVGYEALLNDGFGRIRVQAVSGWVKAIQEELRKMGEPEIIIPDHYAIRPDENGIGYVYIDKDVYDGKYGKQFAKHILSELTEIRKYPRERRWLWSLNELVTWLSIKGDPAEVAEVLTRIHNAAPPLPEAAQKMEIVKELPPIATVTKEASVKPKVGINGFGRIGKLVLKAYLDKEDNSFEVVAVNDLDPIESLAHLFRHDSTMGAFKGEVKVEGDTLVINGHRIKVFNKKDPAEIPWKDLGVEVVIESTGKFTKRKDASRHLLAGAKQVVITAPGEEEDLTVVLGVNEGKYNPELHKIISNASCTTNCLAPVAKVLNEAFGVEIGNMVTIHAFTNDQVVLDGPHKDKRRGRTILNMIPTKTGAAKAVGLVLPELQGKINGFAIRVPTADVSVVKFTALLKTKTTKEEVNAVLKKAAQDEHLGKYLGYTEEELVSSDFLHDDRSSIVDASLTDVTGGKLVTVVAWYDNEWGYSNRTVDLVNYLFANQLKGERAVRGAAAGGAIEKLSIAKVGPSPIKVFGGASTVRLDMELAGGAKGYFVVPAGTSSGTDEAPTVMNKGGFEQVGKNIKEVIAEVIRRGLKADQVVEIGKLMLGMGKDRLGAETTLSVQMSSAWSAASQQGLENYELIRRLNPKLAPIGIPRTKIQYNITNGGLHAKNSLDMQEFMVVASGRTVAESNQMCDKIDRQLGLIYQALGLKANPDDKGVGPLRGKEGGYKIEDLTLEKLAEIYANIGKYNISNLNIQRLKEQNAGVHEFVLNCLLAAIQNAGYEASTSGKAGTVALALDAAASSMLVEGREDLYKFEGRQITSAELIDIYMSWVKKYAIDSIEDGLGENDWEGWIKLIDAVGDKVLVIGDDLLVTQAGRLLKLIQMLQDKNLIGTDGKVTKNIGILIKLNQNGFLTTGINDPAEGYLGTLEVIQLADKYGIKWVVSHRSNEAEAVENEVSIADLAAGTNAYALKSGDHVQAVRAVKEDRLAAIDARERNISLVAQEAKVSSEEYRGAKIANRQLDLAYAGRAFGTFIDTVQVFQKNNGKVQALIVGPEFFKTGGTISFLNQVARLDKNLKIAVYGDNSSLMKLMLDNEAVITADTLDALLAKLRGLGIVSKDIFLVVNNYDFLQGNILSMLEREKIKSVVEDDMSSIAIAKAIKELANDKQVDVAFGQFYSAVGQEGVISKEAYSATNGSMLKQLDTEIFSLPYEIQLTKEKSDETKEAREALAEFMDKV